MPPKKPTAASTAKRRSTGNKRSQSYNKIHDIPHLRLGAAEPRDRVDDSEAACMKHDLTDEQRLQLMVHWGRAPLKLTTDTKRQQSLKVFDKVKQDYAYGYGDAGKKPKHNWQILNKSAKTLARLFDKYGYFPKEWGQTGSSYPDWKDKDEYDEAIQLYGVFELSNHTVSGVVDVFPISRLWAQAKKAMASKIGDAEEVEPWGTAATRDDILDETTRCRIDDSVPTPYEIIQNRLIAEYPSKVRAQEDAEPEVEEEKPSVEEMEAEAMRYVVNGAMNIEENLQPFRRDFRREDKEAPEQVLLRRTDQLRNPKACKHKAFMAHGILSPEERGYLMRAAKPLMEPLDAHFEQRYRQSSRAMIRSESIATDIFNRIVKVMKPEDYRDRIPLCFSQEGQWLPLGCNECIKIVRYEPGGLFAMHRDAPWIPSADQASLFTVIVYLNEDFNGGFTAFETHHFGPRSTCNYDSKAAYVAPCAGSAVLFNHDMWHGGTPVVSGAKWILRTEMIFQRVRTHYVDRFVHAEEAAFLEARRLYDKSMLALQEGRRAEFVETYQQVIDMQQQAMLETVSERCRQGRIVSGLNEDVFADALDFLSDADVVRCVLPINKATYYATVQSALWERRCVERFPAAVSPLSAAILRASSAGGSELQDDDDFGGAHSDWFGLYAGRCILSQRFCPATLVMTTTAIYAALHEGATPSIQYAPHFSGSSDSFMGTACVDLKDCKPASFAVWMQGLYQFETGDAYHLNLPPCDRYTPDAVSWSDNHLLKARAERSEYAEDWTYGLEVEYASRPICKNDGSVSWSVLSMMLQDVFNPIWSPLLIVGHPAMFAGSGSSIAVRERLARHRHDAFHLLRSPAIMFVHPAVVAARAAAPSDAIRLGTGRLLVLFRMSVRTDYFAVVDLAAMKAVRTERITSKIEPVDGATIASCIAVDCTPVMAIDNYDDHDEADTAYHVQKSKDAADDWDISSTLSKCCTNPELEVSKVLTSCDLITAGVSLAHSDVFREVCTFDKDSSVKSPPRPSTAESKKDTAESEPKPTGQVDSDRVWEFKDFKGWKPYDKKSNEAMHKHVRVHGCTGILWLKVPEMPRQAYEVDFDKMQQTNLGTKKKREVRLRPEGLASAPSGLKKKK